MGWRYIDGSICKKSYNDVCSNNGTFAKLVYRTKKASVKKHMENLWSRRVLKVQKRYRKPERMPGGERLIFVLMSAGFCLGWCAFYSMGLVRRA